MKKFTTIGDDERRKNKGRYYCTNECPDDCNGKCIEKEMETEMNTKYIILAGNLGTGWQAYGPFDDMDKAIEWGNSQERYSSVPYEILELNEPEED